MSELLYDEMCRLSDEELCGLVRSGQRLAEEILVTRYFRIVRAVARPYFLAGGSSEDLIQEGMLGLINAIREYSPEKSVPFQSFAERCVRNKIFSSIRAASREKHSPLNNYIPFDTEAIIPSADGTYTLSHSDPEELLLSIESRNELFDEIKSLLSSFETEVLTMYLDGLSSGEISAATGRSAKSVDNAVQRVRRKLTRHFHNGDSR